MRPILPMRPILRALGAFGRDRRAAAAVEMALIAPALFTLSLGGFEVSHLVSAQARLASAAAAMAGLVAQQSSVDSTAMSNFCSGAKLVMSGFATGSLQITVASVTRDSTGSVAVDWQDTSCGGGAQIGNATSLAAPLIPNDGDSAILVQAKYNYASPVAFVLPAAFALSETSMQRPRNVASVTHN